MSNPSLAGWGFLTYPAEHCVFGLPCPDIVEDVIDKGEGVLDGASDTISERIDLVTDVGELLVDIPVYVATDVAPSVASGVSSRGATFGNYVYRSRLNSLEDPFQAAFDSLTGTTFLSDLHAVYAVGSGAHISDTNCVDDAVCFVGGVSVPELVGNGHSLFALGTTIHAGQRPLSEKQGRHEGQHVQDFQRFGGFAFVGLYGAESAAGVDYENLFFEKRANAAEISRRGRDFTGTISHIFSRGFPF